MQEVNWKGQGARFVGSQGRRYELWRSGNDSESGGDGVGTLVKEKMPGNVWKLEEKSTNSAYFR